MSVQMICPNLRCRKILGVPDDVRGKLVKCQYCQTAFRVPEAKKPDATVAAGEKKDRPPPAALRKHRRRDHEPDA